MTENQAKWWHRGLNGLLVVGVVLLIAGLAKIALAQQDDPNFLVGVLKNKGKNEGHQQTIPQSMCNLIIANLRLAKDAGKDYIIPLPTWPNAPAIDAYCVRQDGTVMGPYGQKQLP